MIHKIKITVKVSSNNAKEILIITQIKQFQMDP